MAGYQASDTMPKLGHVTDLREQWLVRTDGALANRLQDREISSHLCENRYRNQQIREDFPVALHEQMDIEQEARSREYARRRQAETDAEIAREMAEINLRRQRRQHSTELLQQPGTSHASEPVRLLQPRLANDIDPEELGLSTEELEEMRRRLEQEERDARLAQQLSHEVDNQDVLLADMRFAVEAQDGELARLLQEREYKKLQRAKEKARQKALLKKQQRLAQQQHQSSEMLAHSEPQAQLLDAYSNPRDMIQQQNGQRLCKSVDSDLHYVEPFEKEHIQSKSSALQSKEMSRQWFKQNGVPGSLQDSHKSNRLDNPQSQSKDFPDHAPNSQSLAFLQHRQPPPVPAIGKKPRFPEPVSIRPASHYTADSNANPIHDFDGDIDNNNMYSSTFPLDHGTSSTHSQSGYTDTSKRLSVISDITPEGLAKKKSKQAELSKKRRGCKIQ